jgi:biotin carboxyl carrier protein
MFKISSPDYQVEIEKKNEGTFMLNGKSVNADIIQISNNKLHLIVNNKSYTAELVNIDESGKQLQLKLNDKIVELSVKNKMDLLLESMGLDKALLKTVKDMKAPMPGLVVNILVKEGDIVKKGDTLLTLEAMKMENSIKSPADLSIKKINIQKGQALEKGQVMIEFA